MAQRTGDAVWVAVVIGGAIILYLLYENSQGGGDGGGGGVSGASSSNPFVNALANSIARLENANPNINNPGDLTAGDVDSGSITGVFNSAGVVVISDLQTGWNSLTTKLQNILSGASSVFSPDMTIQQFAALYTTGDENDTSDATNNYASGLASDLGVTTDTSLSDAEAGYGQ